MILSLTTVYCVQKLTLVTTLAKQRKAPYPRACTTSYLFSVFLFPMIFEKFWWVSICTPKVNSLCSWRRFESVFLLT